MQRARRWQHESSGTCCSVDCTTTGQLRTRLVPAAEWAVAPEPQLTPCYSLNQSVKSRALSVPCRVAFYAKSKPAGLTLRLEWSSPGVGSPPQYAIQRQTINSQVPPGLIPP